MLLPLVLLLLLLLLLLLKILLFLLLLFFYTTTTTVLLVIFKPDRFLAHKDEEHEDSAKQVEDVHAEEEVVEEKVFKVRPVSDEDRVDAFESPQEAKDEEELCVEYLHTYFSVYCNRESDLD